MSKTLVRLVLMILNLIVNNYIVFSLLGFINRILPFIGSIFIAYPATEEYASRYSYRWFRSFIKWRPFIIGFLFQNGRITISTAISATESDFLKNSYSNKLKLLVKRANIIKRIINAEQINYAGILHGILFMKRIIKEPSEANVTVDAVLNAEKKVRIIENCSPDTPIIILGGKGFIGRRLSKKIKNNSDRNIYEVDLDGCAEAKEKAWPKELVGEKAILINVTKKNVLADYIPYFWKELILINEVYPEPSENEVYMLKNRGVKTYHLVGVKAKAFPSFPRAYKGGIPCCAAVKSDYLSVILKKLN